MSVVQATLEVETGRPLELLNEVKISLDKTLAQKTNKN
jgi:hypothetical protein